MRDRSIYAAASLVLVIVALVYWPVIHADFVWDDITDFVDNNWLTFGDDWKHYVLKDFNGWTNYFRPLIVAFFTLQVRLFNVAPGPMHAVNLTLHLIDTILVGLLARQICKIAQRNAGQTVLWIAFCMALYGLHPVLIEPVAWIGCQFDLAATLFMLLGLLAQICIQSIAARAIAVALCFLLAAGCKESAAVFPLLLAVFEWALYSRVRAEGMRSAFIAFIRRNRLTYLALLVAGIVYLAVRHWALGQLIGVVEETPQSFSAQMQKVVFIYLHYWRTLFWPMSGMGPVHPVDVSRFTEISTTSLLMTGVAISLAAGGFYFAIRQASPIGCIVAVMTIALLPVLHITSAALDPSLYHERYVITGLAICCALLPLLRLPQNAAPYIQRLGRTLVGIVAIAWFGYAVFSIRTTIPLWSNSVSLWRWALIVSPDAIDAKANLLAAYVQSGDKVSAYKLGDRLLAEHTRCAECFLSLAFLHIHDNHPDLATPLLEQVRDSRQITTDKSLYRQYLLATGQMLVLQGHPEDAESLFRLSMSIDPHDPQPLLSLVSALAMQGKEEEARQTSDAGIAMLPLSQQAEARKNFAKLLKADLHSLSSPASSKVPRVETSKP